MDQPGNHLPPLAHHGALDFAELQRLGLNPDEVLDFSVNSNPFGPSPKVIEALRHVPIDRYPDRESLALRQALSNRLGVPVSQILAGSGTAELIWLVGFCFLGMGKWALILGPTFGEYERAAQLMGARVDWVRASAEAHFSPPLELFETRMQQLAPDVVFVCNPNNPTGQWIDAARIGAWAKKHPNALFVIDEAYQQFVPGSVSAIQLRELRLPNILVLRSMTKDYALAGLRLGYAVGAEAVIERLAQACVPWHVSGFAQAAGLAALEDEGYYRHTWDLLLQARERFLDQLRQHGLHVLDSSTHYYLVQVGQAAEFRQRLLQHRISVRDCTSFGLPEFIRVSTRTPADNQIFAARISQLQR